MVSLRIALWRCSLFMLSDIWLTSPKVNRFGWNGALWLHCLGLALADFGRDPCSSEIWRARRNFLFFLLGKQRFYRFLVGQISRNLNTTRRSVSRWILSEQNFENFPVRGRFFQKTQNIKFFFNILRLQAAITPQWLQIDRNSLPSDPSTGCLVSIFTVGINLKSFPWPVHSVQET